MHRVSRSLRCAFRGCSRARAGGRGAPRAPSRARPGATETRPRKQSAACQEPITAREIPFRDLAFPAAGTPISSSPCARPRAAAAAARAAGGGAQGAEAGTRARRGRTVRGRAQGRAAASGAGSASCAAPPWVFPSRCTRYTEACQPRRRVSRGRGPSRAAVCSHARPSVPTFLDVTHGAGGPRGSRRTPERLKAEMRKGWLQSTGTPRRRRAKGVRNLGAPPGTDDRRRDITWPVGTRWTLHGTHRRARAYHASLPIQPTKPSSCIPPAATIPA